MDRRTGEKIFLSAFAALFLGSAAAGPLPAGDEDAWRRELLKERALKEAEFKTSVTSPMAGRERLTIPAGEKSFVVIRSGGVSVSAGAGEGAAFALLFRGGKWFWDEAAPGVECRWRTPPSP